MRSFYKYSLMLGLMLSVLVAGAQAQDVTMYEVGDADGSNWNYGETNYSLDVDVYQTYWYECDDPDISDLSNPKWKVSYEHSLTPAGEEGVTLSTGMSMNGAWLILPKGMATAISAEHTIVQPGAVLFVPKVRGSSIKATNPASLFESGLSGYSTGVHKLRLTANGIDQDGALIAGTTTSSLNQFSLGTVYGHGHICVETDKGFPQGDYSAFISSDYSLFEFGGAIRDAEIVLPQSIEEYNNLYLSGGKGTTLTVGYDVLAMNVGIVKDVDVDAAFTIGTYAYINATVKVNQNGILYFANPSAEEFVLDSNGKIYGTYGCALSEGSYSLPLYTNSGNRSSLITFVAAEDGAISAGLFEGTAANAVGSTTGGESLIFNDSYWKLGNDPAAEYTATGMLTFDYDTQSTISLENDNPKLYKWTSNSWVEVAATFDAANGTITVTDEQTISGTTYYTLAKIAGDDAVRTWTGKRSVDWFNANNWSPAMIPSSVSPVVIPSGKSRYPVINYTGDVAEAANITIESGASLTVGDETLGGGLLEVGSVISGAGSLNINSVCAVNQWYHGMSSIKANVANTIEVTVNRTITMNRFWYIGSAVQSGTVSSEEPNSILKKLDAEAQEYVALGTTNFGTDMTKGVKYVYANQGAGGKHVITQVGQLYAQNMSATTIHLESTNTTGDWQLLSNPYSYAIPITSDVFSFYNCSASMIVKTLSENKYVEIAYDVNGVSSGEEVAMLAPNQAFLVRKTSETGASVTINPTEISLSNSEVTLKGLKVNSDVLHLTIASEGAITKSMALSFSTKSVDAPAYELAEDGDNGIYGVKGDNLLLIAGYPALARAVAEGTTMPIAVELSKDADMWTITASDIDRFNTRYDVYLLDKANGNVVNLREAKSYTFTSDVKGQLVKDRFVVSFSKPEVDDPEDQGDETTAVETVEAQSEIAINAIGNAEVAVAAKGDADVTVYNLAGVPVKTAKVKGGNGVVAVGSKGLYVVKVATESGVASKKLLVK